MPAGAGTPRYEKPELWFGTANRPGGFCHARPRPQRGTSPRTTFFFSGHRPWIYNSAGFAGGEPASRLIGGHIPDRSPGTCFRTNRKCRLLRVHEGRKSRSCGLVRRVGPADSATPDPGPSGGQAHPLQLIGFQGVCGASGAFAVSISRRASEHQSGRCRQD